MKRVVLTIATALFVLCLTIVGRVNAQDPSLVAQWHMNEGSGNIIYDNSGNGNDGTIYGATWTTGVEASALRFDGVDDYLRIPDDPSLDGFSALTLEVWVKMDIAYGEGPIIEKWHFDDAYLLLIRCGRIYFGVHPQGTGWQPELVSNTVLSAAKWYHIVGVWDGTTEYIYINGQQDPNTKGRAGTQLHDSNRPIIIGAYLENYWWLDGTIDEVKIYSRALSPYEIQTHYEAFSPNNPPVANAGPDQTIGSKLDCETEVTLDGTASYDPDGEPLTYYWSWVGGESTDPSPVITLPLGQTTVTLVVNDGETDSEPDQVNITVVDISSSDIDWSYRVPITIDNTSNPNALMDFQTLIIVNSAGLISAGKMQEDGDDIRFITDSGSPLAYWIESGMNTAETKIWVKVASIPALGTAKIYMYYGNPDATSASYGNATLEFFDDFEGTNLNSDKWEYFMEPGYALLEVTGSDLHLRTNGSAWGPPAITVWSEHPVMQPPFVMEHIGNLLLNDGYDVNCKIELLDEGEPCYRTGAAFEQRQFTYNFFGKVSVAWGYEEIFSIANPSGRFKTRMVVQPEGAVQFYVNEVLMGVSSIKMSTDIKYYASFGIMWNSDYKCDKILFRNYAAIEPSFILGQEEETNAPPVANAGPDQTVDCTSCCATEVTLDGTGSSDPDNDPLTYTWTWDGNEATGPTPTINLPLGTTVITLVVNDGQADSDPDEVEITIEDTTPPEITVSVSPDELWPPNHKMVSITAAVTVSDVCDEDATFVLTSIKSNEPDDAPGAGDGNTVDDIQDADIGTSDVEFLLRAERDGNGDGRIYEVIYTAIDGSENSVTLADTVWVPHSQGKLKKTQTFDEIEMIPVSIKLFQNSPNPFNPETVISYTLPRQSHVHLEVFNITGDKVVTLVNSQISAGYHSVRWDGRDSLGRLVSGGIYLCRFQAGSYRNTIRMLLLK